MLKRRGSPGWPRGLPRHRTHPHSTRSRLLPRFTFRNFAYFVFALVIFAYISFVYQRFFQKTLRVDCEWLRKPPTVCAHGGDSSRAPPNTRAAYELAIAAGVDCIEIDASRTQDGVLVALHDRDLLDVMRKTECKHCLIWAKDDKVIGELNRQSTKTRTGYIVMNDTRSGKASQLVRLEGAEHVGIYYGLVTSNVVNVLHGAGKKVHAWTVDEDDGMVAMLKAGVDSIITNNPTFLQFVIREQTELCILNGATAF